MVGCIDVGRDVYILWVMENKSWVGISVFFIVVIRIGELKFYIVESEE